jgi:hypothetical protein
MDFRRAGVSRQPEQRRRRLWPSRPWRELLRPGPDLLRSRADVRRSRGRADLLRSGRRPGVLRSGSRADLLRSGPDLLQQRLQHGLLQAEEVPQELLQGLDGQGQVPRPEVQEEPLLRSRELLRPGPDLLRSGCPQLLRSGRGADLCGSGCVLLPLSFSELPGEVERIAAHNSFR